MPTGAPVHEVYTIITIQVEEGSKVKREMREVGILRKDTKMPTLNATRNNFFIP